MEILVVLAVLLVLSGPAAFIISLVVLSKVNSLSRRIHFQRLDLKPPVSAPPAAPPPEQAKPPSETKAPPPTPVPMPKTEPPPQVTKVPETVYIPDKPAAEHVAEKIQKAAFQYSNLEQLIGIKGLLIAGIITVFIAVAFFVKYAIDNSLIGPLGRVIIAAVSGLVALALGETTRRRGYGIVAKGVTALGFVLLYVAVFSASYYYHLIDSVPAFVIAILITSAAMLYAVSLNEIVIAFIALLGGFLTPVLVSTGENLPIPLFSYLLVLGTGAMLCGFYRKWRAINILCFAGTIVLYAGWFEKFYRPQIGHPSDPMPSQLPIAVGGIVLFFILYLVLPILHELIKKIKAQKEDVLLLLANAVATFYFLWSILFTSYRTSLAFAALGLCAAHLFVMSMVIKRCKEDIPLRLSLLVIGLFFFTIAVPLYLKMYAIAIAWAAEAVVLLIIGIKYKSIWTQAGAVIALLLSIGQLIHRLPLHTAAFDLVFNLPFASWLFVVAAVIAIHLLFRFAAKENLKEIAIVQQLFYIAAAALLLAAVTMEWWFHCDYNITDSSLGETFFFRGQVLLLTVFCLLIIIRPLSPAGILTPVAATVLMVISAFFTLAMLPEAYNERFTIFANRNFFIALIFVLSLFVSAILLKRSESVRSQIPALPAIYALAAVFLIWILITEQIWIYWEWRYRADGIPANWKFLAHMYTSVTWALYGALIMIIGFWRNIKILRYLALALFAVLLAKVFIFDTSTVKNVYRIAAFAATGITLVAVSYLYQFLKKKGFFDTVMSELNPKKSEQNQ